MTYTWCHGPAGTSYLFAALAYARVDSLAGFEVSRLRPRCLHSILRSGIPERLRPGFWDNDGRCCGTAGVGEVLLDAAQDCTDPAAAGPLLQAARTMADALAERAIRDEAGARWRFLEHRQDPPLLPPGTSWMQGAAGIAAFLLPWPGSSRAGWTPRSSSARTSGGPFRPVSAPSASSEMARHRGRNHSPSRSAEQEPDPPQPGDRGEN